MVFLFLEDTKLPAGDQCQEAAGASETDFGGVRRDREILPRKRVHNQVAVAIEDDLHAVSAAPFVFHNLTTE
jgi:hypothetical protein